MRRDRKTLPGRSFGVIRWLGSLLLISTPTSAEMTTNARVHLAAQYMIQAQQDTGFFRYEHDFLSGRDSKKNNIVRQAGAAYALGEYFHSFPDAGVRSAVLAALKAFDATSISWKQGRLLSLDGTPKKAKAGATALALLASLQMSPDPAAEFLQLAETWIRGLLALQLPDGGFASRPGSLRESPYSNGEIWLALGHYQLRHPENAAVAVALVRADKRFIELYGNTPDIGFFHWGVMAAAIRYQTTAEPRFADFIARQMEHYIDRMRPNINPRSNSCYAVEGLVEGANVLRQLDRYQPLYQRVRERIADEMQKNRALQIVPDQTRHHFSETRYLVAPELAAYAGAFLNGPYRPQIRIDATQHCLSAMLKLIP